MLKLFFQLMVLAFGIGLTRSLELGLVASLGVAISGIVLTHLAYERLLGGGSSNAVMVRVDDPLMVQALACAKETWPQFLDFFDERPGHCMVKFRLQTSLGIENVWGDLVSLEGDRAAVLLRTPPDGSFKGSDQPVQNISISEIVDWQVVFEDETIAGGFTQQAVIRIIERDSGGLPEHCIAELARYRPVSGEQA